MAKNVPLEEAIIRAYKIIGHATPIKADCGKLCGAACCKDAPPADYKDEPPTDYRNKPPADYKDKPHAGYEKALPADSKYEPPADERLAAPGASGEGEMLIDCGSADTLNERELSGAPLVPGDALGMVLFPGEAGLLSREPGYRLFRIPFLGARAWFLVCEGICDRRKRPLACRIFPLAPHVGGNGEVDALPDPRAGRVCPLADGEFLDPAFRRAVTKALRHLARTPEINEFIRLLSADLDDMRRFIKYMR